MSLQRHGQTASAWGVALAMLCCAAIARGQAPPLGPEEILTAGGSELIVWGYSVPSYVDWDSDGRPDLVVGEGGLGYAGKVRVYLNVGTRGAPAFAGFSYVRSGGLHLVCAASGCLGCFPRVADWNGDAKKDLLIGQADGTVQVFLNVGTGSRPAFDGGALLEAGPAGAKAPVDVGSRATLDLVAWNGDGTRDLVVGALDGRIRVFANVGSDAAPDLSGGVALPDAATGFDLLVPSGRSSPVVTDLGGDGRKDLLVGNTNGELLLYLNVGTDAAPAFSAWEMLTADGVPIDLPEWPRSRPFVCDWTGDGLPDVLLGAGDGRVRLYQSVPEPATVVLLLGIAPVLLRRRR